MIDDILSLLHVVLLDLSLVTLAGEWYTNYKEFGVAGDCVIYPKGSFGLFESICGTTPSLFIENFPSKSDDFLCSLTLVKMLVTVNYALNVFGILNWFINPNKNSWHVVLIFANLVLTLTAIISFFDVTPKNLEYTYSFYAACATCVLSLCVLIPHVRRMI